MLSATFKNVSYACGNVCFCCYFKAMEGRINRIKEILVIQGKSQKWLAEQLGISTTAMTAICNNKSQPHLKDLKRIAKILEVDIRELLVSTLD